MLSCYDKQLAREIAEVASSALISQVHDLHCRGECYYDISKRLDLPFPNVAEAMVARYALELYSDPRKLKRKKEEARLDFLWKHAAANAGQGSSLDWLDKCLKVSERKAKLLGLDTPVKQQVSVSQPASFDASKLTDEEVGTLEAILSKLAQKP